MIASSPFGCGLLKSEKEWAKGGDCFIAVLTSRDIFFDRGRSLPPSWTHAESGLTYDEHRPIFAFIENGVRADAIYQNLDDQHLIRFNPFNPCYDLYLSRNKIQNFREECRHYRPKKSTDGVVDFAKILFAGLGMISVLTFIFKD